MGAGKTTVGRALAKKLNKRFIDSDHEIEARTGASIPLIFEIEGEASFRQRETEAIRDLTAQQGIVLATGGGAILRPENRAYLKTRGTVIYLRASVSSILQRTSHDKNRPLLQTADPRKKIEELAREREPYYCDVADLIIETGHPNVHSLVQTILTQIQDLTGEPSDTQPPIQYDSAELSMNAPQSIPITLQVDLGERSYPIMIGQSLLSNAGLIGQYVTGERAAIVTNTTVGPLYLDQLTKTLSAAGKQVVSIVLPDGEEEKNWANLMRIFDVLLSEKCDRKSTIIERYCY